MKLSTAVTLLVSIAAGVSANCHGDCKIRCNPSNYPGYCNVECIGHCMAWLCPGTPTEAYDNIPPNLYHKAWSQHGLLTEGERRVFLDCGDLLGRVIGCPDAATTDEIHESCALPPPDVVRANIPRATGGMLSTRTELYAEANDALHRSLSGAPGNPRKPTGAHAVSFSSWTQSHFSGFASTFTRAR
ncbi:hypothetical protein C8A05DRAFT_30055 [Staphylotrichum tortipilum]|uniref:Uncharacterized protein n=1 Tax=Staphylotrichum tortipilum TaxID=2831512 RepID=A0AAN6MUY3_9PEZI|nr:hypothetical protein C8A05DRAFT_30055 [Staphylotrichum longicolle]